MNTTEFDVSTRSRDARGRFANEYEEPAGATSALDFDEDWADEYSDEANAAYDRWDNSLNAPGTILDGTPTIEMQATIHVGTLDKTLRSHSSHEGDSLSVSVHPHAWEQINELTVGEHWHIRRASGEPLVFVHYDGMDDDTRDAVRQWGAERGWVTQETVWRVIRYDEELADDIWFEVGTYEEALKEADLEPGDDPESFGVRIEEQPGTWRATDEFPDSRFYDDVDPTDILVSLYVRESLPGVDGVWWEDVYDPVNLSAPRGGIVHPLDQYSVDRGANGG